MKCKCRVCTISKWIADKSSHLNAEGWLSKGHDLEYPLFKAHQNKTKPRLKDKLAYWLHFNKAYVWVRYII